MLHQSNMLILKHGGGFRMLWGYSASDVNMALIKML